MQIRSFSKDDLIKNADKFCALYKKVFTAKMDKEILLQRYVNDIFEDFLMFVAIEDDHIIANYSALPVRLMVGGEERKAALSINTMTDPEYHGKGPFIILARELYKYMIKQNYDMILGFPNCDSNRMFNDGLGWRTIYEIPTLKLSLLGKQTYNISLEMIEDQFDELVSEVAEETVYVKMSKEYIAWRFKDNKEKEYHSLSIDKDNWVIFQRYDSEINITELCYMNEKKGKELIKAVINIGIKEGFQFITLWYKTNTRMHGYLEMLGFKMAEPIRHFSGRCFNESIKDIVYDYRNWRIQMGDDNVY